MGKDAAAAGQLKNGRKKTQRTQKEIPIASITLPVFVLCTLRFFVAEFLLASGFLQFRSYPHCNSSISSPGEKILRRVQQLGSIGNACGQNGRDALTAFAAEHITVCP